MELTQIMEKLQGTKDIQTMTKIRKQEADNLALQMKDKPPS